jgi:hypothetical protein
MPDYLYRADRIVLTDHFLRADLIARTPPSVYILLGTPTRACVAGG